MLNKGKVIVEIWRGIASPVSAPKDTVLEIRDLDNNEVRLLRMAQTDWVLMDKYPLKAGKTEEVV